MTPPRPREARSHRTVLNGINARYLEWGPVDAPPLVLLHGLRSYAHTWDELAGTLVPNFRVLALDLRGRGHSGWDPERNYHADAYARDLEQWVDELGLRRFALLGHSLGGAVALLYSAAHPERVASLVLEDSGPGAAAAGAGAERIAAELAATPARFDTLGDARAYWRSVRPHITDEALDSRVRHTIVARLDGGFEWRLDLQGIADARRRFPSPDLWPAVERLKSPTLLVRGAESDYCTADIAERMEERQPLIRTVVVEGAGHYVHDDRPDPFAAAVRAFLVGEDSR